jgi:hypothetical protein
LTASPATCGARLSGGGGSQVPSCRRMPRPLCPSRQSGGCAPVPRSPLPPPSPLHQRQLHPSIHSTPRPRVVACSAGASAG